MTLGMFDMSESIPSNLVAQTWSRAFEPPESIPESADIVIIGGGIVGVSTAWFLAKKGVNIVLCEKGHIAGEQSGRNWGWVRQQGRDLREMPMVIESLKIWRTLADEIGEDVGYRQTGCLYAARDDDQLDGYAGWLPTAKEYGLDTRIISGKEASQYIPGTSATWKGGLYTASDGRAEPHKATPAIAHAAERNGATILTACAVRGLETEAGRVSTVVTEHGTIKTSVVLCAAGAWTSMFCRSLGISLPQIKVRGTVVRTAPGKKVLDSCLWEERIGIRRRQDGGYTVANGALLDHSITPSTFRYANKFLPALKKDIREISLSIGRDFIDEWRTPKKWRLDVESPFERTRVLNPSPNPKAVRTIRKAINEMFPSLADSEIVETWAGMIETTPDVIPVIEESDKIPGFHIATGFCGHGFGIGPGAGKAIAGMLTGADTGIDLSPFRLSRFFDGTKILLQQEVESVS
jgi:glycine/D-amino acid oxidase-like deaminating enzyme